MVSPILVALDMPDLTAARALAIRLEPYVTGFKVGLELMMAQGPGAVSEIAGVGAPVFADAKLHDIPNTVEKAAYQLAKRGARWVTVHGGGGGSMIAAASTGLMAGALGEAGALVVSVLTSLDREGLAEVGFSRSLGDQVAAMSRLGAAHGAEGVVCSPHEAGIVKSVSAALLAVTPGIRLPTGAHHDQRRVATPVEAVSNGADLLVMGRAITDSPDPVRVVSEVTESLVSQRLI